MTPLFHPHLVNGRSGDPVVYVDVRFGKRGILFDLGDLSALPERKILRITDIFVSHTHVDHFVGFDRLLRVLLGRERVVRLFGPEGLIEGVGHKLAAYTWNLVDRFRTNLTFSVTEIAADGRGRTASFALRDRFAEGPARPVTVTGGVAHHEETFEICFTVLDHKIACHAYALQEIAHINVWKNRLEALGLKTGPWLRELKHAVLSGEADDRPIGAAWREGRPAGERTLPLGYLKREILRVVPGQRLVYVTDALYTARNRRAILELARQADIFFIEAAFAGADADLALDRGHLTTYQAGTLARQAGARRIEPFHFSPRYAGAEAQMLSEVQRAFAGGAVAPAPAAPLPTPSAQGPCDAPPPDGFRPEPDRRTREK